MSPSSRATAAIRHLATNTRSNTNQFRIAFSSPFRPHPTNNLARTFSTSRLHLAELADPPSPPSSASLGASPQSFKFASLVTEGEDALSQGSWEKARDLFSEALKIERDGAVLFNKGLTEFVLKNHQEAISLWLESIAVQPDNADVHMNIANAYILTSPPKGHLAEKHLREAFRLSPLDAEVVYNLAAVLEANGQLTESIVKYEQARTLGVPKAAQNVISVGAKIAAAQEKAEAAKSKKD